MHFLLGNLFNKPLNIQTRCNHKHLSEILTVQRDTKIPPILVPCSFIFATRNSAPSEMPNGRDETTLRDANLILTDRILGLFYKFTQTTS